MKNSDVRIIKLDPLHVAAVLGFGTEPERLAWGKIMAFVEAKNLTDVPGTRYFGFNNPNPSAGSPNYGYEQWVTIAPDVEALADVEIKDFSGGLYAVTRCQGVANISKTWQELVSWAENSPYQRAHHQWLEEAVGPVPPEDDTIVLDLYMPIAE